MEFWNTIINSALLGNAKKPITASDAYPEFAGVFESISSTAIDTEEKFLQLASVSFNYRKCGISPSKNEAISIETAPAEEKPYCNQEAIQSLKDIIHAENYALIQLWLELCQKGNAIVYPELIPYLFSIAEKHKNLQAAIKNCSGKRGEWISQFNPAWNFSSSASDEELWQTGSPEQRRIVLSEARRTEPAKGREWLQQCWQQENANMKAELLKIIAINISLADESWLQSLLTEKSQKVKDETWNLLKQIPDSFIVKKYEELLKQSLSLKKEKALLGLLNKSKIEIKLPSAIDESIFKSGIEKLSSSKEVGDDEYIIYQILQFVPPAFLEKNFEAASGEVLDILNKDSIGKRFITALASSIGRFKDKKWALAFAPISDTFFPEVAGLLSQEEEEKYLIKNISSSPEAIIIYAMHRNHEWGTELAKYILDFTSKNPYQYNRQFYNQNIHLIPVKVKSELPKISVEEGFKTMWENLRDHLQNLISLKEQTIQSFSKTVK